LSSLSNPQNMFCVMIVIINIYAPLFSWYWHTRNCTQSWSTKKIVNMTITPPQVSCASWRPLLLFLPFPTSPFSRNY
jgi:hypothetical protein